MVKIRIAVQGCCHGELRQVFDKVRQLNGSSPIDLLIILGDFQSIRDEDDFQSISIPPKYRKYGDFNNYYHDDSLKPPVMTLFIGGNHESMRHLMLLPHGGYVANNIYYMGYSNVIWYRGVRIGGISGIWKKWDFYKKRPNWNYLEENCRWNDKVRELYHTRESDILPLFMMCNSINKFDIMLSHDWPNGAVYEGNVQDILKKKPFFSRDIESRQLGSPRSWELLRQLKPRWWLSAHLHVKFEAEIKHISKRPIKKNDDELELQLSSDEDEKDDRKEKGDGDVLQSEQTTNFLALDKCLPRRKWLEIIEVESDESHKSYQDQDSFFYDPHFIACLQLLRKNQPISLNNMQYGKIPTDVDWQHYIVPRYVNGLQRQERLQTNEFEKKFFL